MCPPLIGTSPVERGPTASADISYDNGCGAVRSTPRDAGSDDGRLGSYDYRLYDVGISMQPCGGCAYEI